jgi:hypothetical protein
MPIPQSDKIEFESKSRSAAPEPIEHGCCCNGKSRP